jgi:hypothetical protein
MKEKPQNNNRRKVETGTDIEKFSDSSKYMQVFSALQK